MPAERPKPRTVPVAGRVAQLAVLSALVAYAVSTFTVERPPGGIHVVLDGWLYNSILFGNVAILLWRASAREDRVAWSVLGAGLLSWSGGWLYWTLVVRHMDPEPFPSLADAMWLGFYPAAYASILLLARRRTARMHPTVWLDAAAGGLATAAVLASMAFGTIVDSASGSRTEVVVNLAYPLADLLLIALVAGILALSGRRADPAWYFLGAGLVVLITANTIYLHQVTVGSYQSGTFLDVLWPTAIMLISCAPWRSPARSRRLREEGWAQLLVPIGSAFAAVSVLVADHFRRMPGLAVSLAAASLVVAGTRTISTVREARALAESRRQARTDELTGLGNRRLFRERLGDALDAREDGDRIALLLIDLDRFKEINDSLGHDVGDDLLRRIGPRLSRALRGSDVLVRLDGDEFAVLLGPGADAEYAGAVAGRVLDTLDEPFRVGAVSLHVQASVGISLCPDHADQPGELLRRADVAMYQAKAARTGCELYQPERDHNSVDRLRTMEELRAAVDRGEITLHYQPKADLRTGRVTGVEALVRWQHPDRGLLYPDAFLPIAEMTGMMQPLTRAILSMALDQCRSWRDAGHDLPVAVNLSASDLVEVDLAPHVKALLAERGLPPHSLVLEITESTIVADADRARRILSRLQRLGVEISVDDYGTGYSSLAYLHRLPIDELKIDKSFLTDLRGDHGAEAIVRSTIDLAHTLGLRVVAEGVETPDTWFMLAEFGCDLAQGYLLTPPLDPEQLLTWMATRSASNLAVPAPTGC